VAHNGTKITTLLAVKRCGHSLMYAIGLSMNTSPIDPNTCPVCGASNRCTLANPRTVGQACWCFTAAIDPAYLEALSEEVRGQACLCPQCAGVEAANRDAS
jgi:hypothetical protein